MFCLKCRHRQDQRQRIRLWHRAAVCRGPWDQRCNPPCLGIPCPFPERGGSGAHCHMDRAFLTRHLYFERRQHMCLLLLPVSRFCAVSVLSVPARPCICYPCFAATGAWWLQERAVLSCAVPPGFVSSCFTLACVTWPRSGRRPAGVTLCTKSTAYQHTSADNHQ